MSAIGSSLGADDAALDGSGRNARVNVLRAAENQEAGRSSAEVDMGIASFDARLDPTITKRVTDDQIETERIIGLHSEKANQIFAKNSAKTERMPTICCMAGIMFVRILCLI